MGTALVWTTHAILWEYSGACVPQHTTVGIISWGTVWSILLNAIPPPALTFCTVR